MKKILFTFFILIINNFFTQTLNFESVQNAPNNNYSEYLASDKYAYKIGDTIKIGKPSSSKDFNYIVKFFNNDLTTLNKVPSHYSGFFAVISKIMVVNSKCIIEAESKNSAGTMTYSIQFEEAINNDEIEAKGMTGARALKELKLAKEKLDLGLISNVEYNLILSRLKNFIKD
jgi:hypothetical protein